MPLHYSAEGDFSTCEMMTMMI